MPVRKMYAGGAVATTLNGAITGASSTIVVTNGSTYPDGSSGPFVISIDRGVVGTEEKILITSRAGNSLTVNTRGYDGTSALGHNNLAVVEHVLDAVTVDEANRLTNLGTTKGDVIVRSATDWQRLAVGATDGMFFVVDAAQTLGVKWLAPPAKVVLTDANQSIPDFATTDITWGTEVSDVDGWTSGGSASLTVPAAANGRQFIFSYTGVWQGVAENGFVLYTLGGTEMAASGVLPAILTGGTSLCFVRTVATGEVYKWRAGHNHGSAVNIASRLEIAPIF